MPWPQNEMMSMYNKNFLAYNDKYTYDVLLATGQTKGRISDSDSKLITAPIVEKLAKGKICERRAARVADMLIQWRRFIPVPYEQLTLDNLLLGLQAFKKGKNTYGREYRQSTQRSMIKTINTFTKYLNRKGVIKPIDAEELKEIQPPKEDFSTIRPEDLYTEDDINAMLKVCKNSRDRAIIITLYETGARVGELGSLTWNDLTFDDIGCRVRLGDQKVGGVRIAYVVTAKPYLLQYRNDSPFAKNEDFVFKLWERDDPITYKAIIRLLANVKSATGIKKRVTPKLFRTSRITNMVKEGYQESIIKKMMWQKPSTVMLDHYLKLAGKDVEQAVLAHIGIERKEDKPVEPMMPIKCICGHLNEPTNIYCPKCARSLRDGIKSLREQISEADREFAKLLQNERVVTRYQTLAEG